MEAGNVEIGVDVIGNMLSEIRKEKLKLRADQAPIFNLHEFIHKSLESSNEIEVPELETKYRASMVSRLCEREEAIRHFHRLTKLNKIGAQLQMTFDFGHGFHEVVQNKWFAQWGLLWGDWSCFNCGNKHSNCLRPTDCKKCGEKDTYKYVEISFDDAENFITGHPDGILVLPNGERVLLELKTTSSKSFDWVIGRLRGPYESHIWQVQIYMWFTKTTSCSILYFDKDRSQFIIYKVAYDAAKMETVKNRIKLIKESIRTKKIPRRYVCELSSCTRAKSCSVRKICFNLPTEGVDNVTRV